MIPVVDERSMHARDANDKYHESLGHPNMVVTKSTAKARDVELPTVVRKMGARWLTFT